MTTEKRIEQWTTLPFDTETITAVKALANQPTELEDAFYKEAEFGTGGIRGIMGVGTNRINRYTLGKATQGLANYLKTTQEAQNIKVVIAYDCRNNSKAFAQIVAQVLSANNITTYLFSDLRPTPLLSFAVRHLKADSGIVLTASHNPPEYNGFKVYNQHGGQIVPPEDTKIIAAIEALEFSDINWEGKKELILHIDQEVDDAYASTIVEKSLLNPTERKNNSIVLTSLHGTAIVNLPPVLKMAGYNQVHIVEEQAKPDGNFSTVNSPNPEEKEAFTLALQKAKAMDADIILGTDPDADRLGIGVKDDKGQWILLNGNQMMMALTRFVLEYSALPENAFIASTIVSTPMMDTLAQNFGVECKLGLTGFKWIGKMIQDYPDQTFLCGGEESYGFLIGDDVRDKDAISAALLACDLQASLAAKGSSLYSYLIETYQRYGCYHEELVSITKKGKKGSEEIEEMMCNFRADTPTSIAGKKVLALDDFESGYSTSAQGERAKLNFPKANVLRFLLEDGWRVAIRPSGTEPKIKYYFSVNCPLEKVEDYPKINQFLKSQCQQLIQAFT
ncbi:MAG: phospho-sugar mutase [Flavobacteriaceae bacterium]